MSRGKYNGMPSKGGQGPGEMAMSPAFSIAAVRATVVSNGRVYVDADDLDTGQHYTRCPLMVFGGDPDRFGIFPVALRPSDSTGQWGSDREVLLLHRPGGRPYALGMKQHQDFAIEEAVNPTNEGADHPLAISKNDIAFRNGGSMLILDEHGAVTVVAADTEYGKYLRLQLPDEHGRVRISRGGEADERVILANAFLDTWVNQTLRSHLTAQDARITALEAQVVALTASIKAIPVVGAVPVTAGTPPVAQAVIVEFAPVGTQTPPSADDSLKSGSIQVSKKPLAQESKP